MKSSKNVFKCKRARPAFGTFLSIEIECMEDATAVITRAFALAEKLEQTLSKFRVDSDLNRLNSAPAGANIEIPEFLAEVLQLALEIYCETRGAFNPFITEPADVDLVAMNGRWIARKTKNCAFDFSGIAKGYSVDQICAMIEKELPLASGVVNAGGDLRFIKTAEKEIAIRSAADPTALRRVRVNHEGVATSSFAEFRGNPLSSTLYTQVPAPGLDEGCSVTVLAEDCAIADALTKAVWFGDATLIADCAKKYNAEVLIFNDRGEQCGNYA